MYETPESPPSWMLTCGSPELCPGDGPLIFTLGSTNTYDPGSAETADLERARCMAAALRDRTPGQLHFWSGEVGREFSLEILGELALGRSVATINDINDSYGAYEGLYRLHPPEHFFACAAGDALQVWLCLVDFGPDACEPGPLPCMN